MPTFVFQNGFITESGRCGALRQISKLGIQAGMCGLLSPVWNCYACTHLWQIRSSGIYWAQCGQACGIVAQCGLAGMCWHNILVAALSPSTSSSSYPPPPPPPPPPAPVPPRFPQLSYAGLANQNSPVLTFHCYRCTTASTTTHDGCGLEKS